MSRKLLLRGSAFAVVLALLAGVAVNSTSGDEPKKATGKQKVIETEGKKMQCCAGTDFGAALGLSLQSLGTLGARIDQNKMNLDPVSLALCARELHVAEAISKKTAPLTSDDLLKQAIDMAKNRNQADELKAVAQLAGSPEIRKELMEQAEKAARAAEERKDRTERKRGVVGTLHVDSRVNYYLTVLVNDGQRRGTMGPYGDVYFDDMGDYYPLTTKVYAYAPGTGLSWGPIYIGPETRSGYHWILTMR